MNSKLLSLSLTVGSGFMLATTALAASTKIDFPAASPNCTIKQHIGLTDIEITYSRPGIKGRSIFGGIVPFDKVWRTGANQATKITFSTPVKLNGTEIPAGTYALMTIPGKVEWTIIINKVAEQWGAYKYDDKQDVARVQATPVHLDRPLETLTIEFNKIHDDSADIDITWDRTEVPIKIESAFDEKLISQIDSVMSSDSKEKPYFKAAQFFYDHGQDLKKASAWIDAAIAEHELPAPLFLKAEILEKMGDKTGAIATAKRCNELAEKANDISTVKQSNEIIDRLK